MSYFFRGAGGSERKFKKKCWGVGRRGSGGAETKTVCQMIK